MSNSYPSQKWKVDVDTAEEIKKYLINQGGLEDKDIKSEHEIWRIKFSDATLTYYKSGTLFCTASSDPSIKEVWEFISFRAGSRFVLPTKDFLIGLDETGKGEILGHTILVGAIFPKTIFNEIEKLVGVADTKKRRSTSYWDSVLKRLDLMKKERLDFYLEKIPPWHVDRFNLNKIMDVVYQRILSNFMRHVQAANCRIVLDDYGIGEKLRRYLRSLENAGADVKIIHQADEYYLEARVASLIAKREREKIIEVIGRDEEFRIEGCNIGSGNAGDKETISWLKKWKATGKPWPWFVKQSFRTVREIDGKLEKVEKIEPPLREDILSEDFIKEFEAGRFSITTLSIVCPSCGERSKAALVTLDDERTIGRCIACKKPIKDLNFTLRYYCGALLPDSNIIIGGFLGKDLERTKFFEGFTFLLHPIVKGECDTPGGKRELERLAKFAAIGRIRLEEIPKIDKIEDLPKLERDEKIKEGAFTFNAILITGDRAMKAFAQAKNLFCLHV
jgi:ribonuclease HII